MIDQLIAEARAQNCSDLHLVQNQPPIVRLDGDLVRWTHYAPLIAEVIDKIADKMLAASRAQRGQDDMDFSYVTPSGERQRVNLYRAQGAPCLAIRMLQADIPTFSSLGLPPILEEISKNPRGLVLVTGPTGSGKSTTLAAMIDSINRSRSAHILTLEDPVEYLHQSKSSMVNQREIGPDVRDFTYALREALREDPDVILVGEMRDAETIGAAITAAETGHLVLSTLHTVGAAKTIDRIIDVFPPYQQQQVRTQLATVLKAVVTQTLVPRSTGGGRVAALEIMLVNDAIANLIREGKTFQIASVLQTNLRSGMFSLDRHLAELAKQGIISRENALDRCVSKEEFKRYAGL